MYLYTKKKGSVPKCGDCGQKLKGVSVRITYTWMGITYTWMGLVAFHLQLLHPADQMADWLCLLVPYARPAM